MTIPRIQNQDLWFSSFLVERFSKSYLSSLEKWVLFLPKFLLFVQFVLLFKIEKNIFFLYCMCEPLLFVKDDNCVDKEYEEANEQGVATRRWGCIF